MGRERVLPDSRKVMNVNDNGNRKSLFANCSDLMRPGSSIDALTNG